MDTPHQDDLPLGYEQPDLLDRLIAYCSGLVVACLLFTFSLSILHPGAWADVAVAAGLRPPDTIFPGAGRLLLAPVFSFCGIKAGVIWANVLGNICGGLSVAFFYLFLRELLPTVLTLRSPSRLWSLRMERLVALTGAFAFACSSPVLQLFQSLSGEALLLTVMLGFGRLFLRLLHYGRFSTAYGCLFLLGGLAAETPFGLVLAFVAFMVAVVARHYAWRPDLRYLNPMLVELSKWRLSLFFVLGFACVFVADGWFFIARGGAAAANMSNPELVVDWIKRYGSAVVDASSPLGWLFVLIFVLVPFFVAIFCSRKATDDDSFLPFRAGILFAGLFIISLAPLSAIPYLGFWGWTVRSAVHSPLLLGISCTLLAVAFTLSFAVLAYDIWCRDHKRIVIQRFPELIEDGVFARSHFHWRWRRTITVVAMILIVAVTLPWRNVFGMRRMASFVRDVLLETAAECGDARILVTDGSLDDALRIVFARTGRNVLPLSIMAERSPYERNLRMAAAENDEDRATLALGIPDALRNWVLHSPERLESVAIQVGFELWNRDRSKRPQLSGLLAYAGLSPEEATKGVEAAQGLAERAIAAHSSGAFRRCEDRVLKDKFLFAQWRIARMAALRDENAGAAGEVALARMEADVVKKLDDLNPELKRLNDALSWIQSRDGNSLTPREGLRIALERADFALARRYATPILTADATHPDANFGMGMSYFVEGRYAQAETYLKTALESRPDEPALLNNLAICCYRQERLEEASAYASKALAKLPDAPAVSNTYKQIRKAIDDKKSAAGAK